MSENLRIWAQVCTVPEEHTKPISGGKLNGKTDINPMWRIKTLTELFGACGSGWKVEIAGQGVIPTGEEVVCWVLVNLYYKLPGGEEWSAPIPGYGVDMAFEKQKGAVRPNDECFKMAFTDALGSACKMLGFADNIYSSGYTKGYDGSKYGRSRDEAKPRTNQTAEPKRLPNHPFYASMGVAGLTVQEACAKNPIGMFELAGNPQCDPALAAEIKAYGNRTS